MFFGQIRSQNGNCRNPTAYQFYFNFKKLFAIKFMLITSKNTNCESIDFTEEDSMSFFNIMREFGNKKQNNLIHKNQALSLFKEIGTIENISILPDKNPLTYFSAICYREREKAAISKS